jgi:hypothetical protein|nr:MAG TPA: hypothetical protein [Caudoviricetes sp.]
MYNKLLQVYTLLNEIVGFSLCRRSDYYTTATGKIKAKSKNFNDLVKII